MPPRLNKRQQREQQELAALVTPKETEPNDEIESGDEEPDTWTRPTKPLASGFAAVGIYTLISVMRGC